MVVEKLAEETVVMCLVEVEVYEVQLHQDTLQQFPQQLFPQQNRHWMEPGFDVDGWRVMEFSGLLRDNQGNW